MPVSYVFFNHYAIETLVDKERALWWLLMIAILAIVLWFVTKSIREARRARIERPWQGRQYRTTQDAEDKPNNFNSWEEAFNRSITDDLRFRITYADSDGVVTEREIRPISIHLLRGKPELYIKARCSLRGDERTFFSPRILSSTNLQTGRQIKDLAQYLRAKY